MNTPVNASEEIGFSTPFYGHLFNNGVHRAGAWTLRYGVKCARQRHHDQWNLLELELAR